jgi:hypothetical protein
MSSSIVLIRFFVSGPVSTMVCFPTLPKRGSIVGSSVSVALQPNTPRGPNLSRNAENPALSGNRAIFSTYHDQSDPGNPVFSDARFQDALDKHIHRWAKLTGSTGGFSESSSYSTLGDTLSYLQKLVDTKRRYAMVIPNDLDNAVNNFVAPVIRDIDLQLSEIEKRKNPDHGMSATTSPEPLGNVRIDDTKIWMEIVVSYKHLKNDLRSTLGLDLTPTNIIGQ